MSQAIEERIREAYQHIGQAVSSLQFHDITRQQVEHVEQGIQDMLQMVNAHLADGQELEESDSELLAFMAELCGMEVRQIEAASDRFVQAVDAFAGRLRSVADVLENLGTELAEVRADSASAFRGSQCTALQHIENSVSNVMQSMREFVAQGEAKGEIMDRVTRTIQEMGVFLEDVEEVGASIELIALNASVKAAHTGDKGKAMGVLAQSIQSLSHAARLQTEAISQALSGVATSSEILRANSARFREEVRVEEVLARLGVLLKGLTAVDEETTSLTGEIGAAGHAVSREIGNLAARLTMHHEVAAQLRESAAMLASWQRKCRTLAPEGELGRHSARLEAMLGRYTMEIERQIHLGLAQDDGAGASSEEDLLDGVELF
ncbi:hypothetical protein [Megalodesulfovibrio paquesii]